MYGWLLGCKFLGSGFDRLQIAQIKLQEVSLLARLCFQFADSFRPLGFIPSGDVYLGIVVQECLQTVCQNQVEHLEHAADLHSPRPNPRVSTGDDNYPPGQIRYIADSPFRRGGEGLRDAGLDGAHGDKSRSR
jgi:hypothetical protein